MRLSYIKTAWVMAARELMRSRVALILLILIPTLFNLLIVLTTTDRILAFKLASVSDETFLQVSERRESLIFIGGAAVGLLTSFLALNLVQKHAEVNRRLVLCGYKPWELVMSKLAVLLCVILTVGCYAAALLRLFFRPERFAL